MRLPIGYDNFRDLIDKKLDFVDKTFFIKEVLDRISVQVSLIARPRRFGKTLNLSMLRHFLATQVDGKSTEGLFDGLKITEAGDTYMQHHRRYPVIFVTFKDVKEGNYETAYFSVCKQIAVIYHEHHYLLSSDKLTAGEKEVFISILETRATTINISHSLKDLCRYLYEHHGVKPWLLIDEYDTPIHAGYLNNYYNAIIDFIGKLFGAALKTNNYLDRAVITGILRISKESLFSGANNVIAYSMLDKEYSEHFGFTEIEVKKLLTKANLSDHYANIQEWYNGYQIGESTIYNPWSLINCIVREGLLKTYWVNTSGNDLIKYLLACADESVKMNLESIIRNESITEFIDENMVLYDLDKSLRSVWNLLFFSGYLKVVHGEAKRSRTQCELIAPNREVLFLFQDIVRDWLAEPLGEKYLTFLLSLTEGRVEEFADQLQQYLIQTISIFDASGHEPEKFYHGFVLGMMVSLSDTHEVKSNHESGHGRYDVMLIPKDREQLGIILEFKTVRDKKASLKKAAQEAVQQITNREYAAQLQQLNIQNILKIGLAFRGKQVVVLSHREYGVRKRQGVQVDGQGLVDVEQ
jgi:Predicted AAA-ATPase/PD-(D/E)XK nuclease superfamily